MQIILKLEDYLPKFNEIKEHLKPDLDKKGKKKVAEEIRGLADLIGEEIATVSMVDFDFGTRITEVSSDLHGIAKLLLDGTYNINETKRDVEEEYNELLGITHSPAYKKFQAKA